MSVIFYIVPDVVVVVALVVVTGLIPVLNVLQTESEEVWALAEQTTPGRGEATPGHGLTTGIILPDCKYRYTGRVSFGINQ